MHTRVGRGGMLMVTGATALVGCASSTTMPAMTTAPDEPTAVFSDPERRAKIDAVLPEIDAVFRRNAEESHYPGHVYGVIVDGELVLSGAVGVARIDTSRPVTADTAFHIASLTKSFTAMAILKLRDAGRLSLDDPVRQHIPELALAYPTTDSPGVTIENLLTMTSGLPEDNPWADRRLEDSPEDLVRILRTGVSFSSVPDLHYEYSNLGYAMLGMIIERVSGRSYRAYISDEILAPLGMHDTHWEYDDVPVDQLALGYRWEDDAWRPEPMLHSGAFGAIGGLITTLNDFSRYVAFHLSAWPPRSAPETGPVPRSTVREMHRRATSTLHADARDVDGEPNPFVSGYGYGLGIRTDGRGVTRVSHTGGLPGFGSNVHFFPDHGVAIISFSNRTYGYSGAAHARAQDVLLRDGDIRPRATAISPILAQRAREVAELVQTWDEALGDTILTGNVYLDQSRAARAQAAQRVFEAAGAIRSIDAVQPQNRLRGTFVMHGAERDVRVFLSIAPTHEQRVQAVRLTLREPGGHSD